MAIRISTALSNALMDTAPFKTAMNLCFIDVYSGTQPSGSAPTTGADAAVTGTLLVTISNNSTATGLTWEASATGGVLEKAPAETWSGSAVASGTAGWFRIRLAGDTNAADTGFIYKRVDGSISTSGADMNVGSLTVTAGAPFIISAGSFTLPQT